MGSSSCSPSSSPGQIPTDCRTTLPQSQLGLELWLGCEAESDRRECRIMWLTDFHCVPRERGRKRQIEWAGERVSLFIILAAAAAGKWESESESNPRCGACGEEECDERRAETGAGSSKQKLGANHQPRSSTNRATCLAVALSLSYSLCISLSLCCVLCKRA